MYFQPGIRCESAPDKLTFTNDPIEQYWQEAEGKATFKTVVMSEFPTFFYILGPNSDRLYTSTLVMIER
jgi:hypothetical protein